MSLYFERISNDVIEIIIKLLNTSSGIIYVGINNNGKKTYIEKKETIKKIEYILKNISPSPNKYIDYFFTDEVLIIYVMSDRMIDKEEFQYIGNLLN